LLLWPLLITAAWAQTTQPERKPRPDDFGIVINQTFTPGGQEFYRRFTDFWRERPDFESYTLVILERPSRRYGNQIFITYGQRSVFSGALPAKADSVKALALDAAEKTHANIISLSLRMTGDRDPDMGADDEI
jgi:curli production assembly/transport component CsgE